MDSRKENTSISFRVRTINPETGEVTEISRPENWDKESDKASDENLKEVFKQLIALGYMKPKEPNV